MNTDKEKHLAETKTDDEAGTARKREGDAIEAARRPAFSMETVHGDERRIVHDIFPNLSSVRVIHLDIDDLTNHYHS